MPTARRSTPEPDLLPQPLRAGESIGRLLGDDVSTERCTLLGGRQCGAGTMAIRDLCSGRFATQAGCRRSRSPVSTSTTSTRVTQDRPGELLAALAGELAPYNTTRGRVPGTGTSTTSYLRLHEASTDPGTGLVAALLDDAVRAFTRYVLAFSGLVVLVLDLRGAGEAAPARWPVGPRSTRRSRCWNGSTTALPSCGSCLAGRRWLVPPRQCPQARPRSSNRDRISGSEPLRQVRPRPGAGLPRAARPPPHRVTPRCGPPSWNAA
ncbi:hypothetical protein HBB16_13725 [Pseudonocardia sp. MCCB 268]|nr:hypothetical protein [Pseudonocardia cytotoxica]